MDEVLAKLRLFFAENFMEAAVYHDRDLMLRELSHAATPYAL